MNNISIYISAGTALAIAIWNFVLQSRLKKLEAENLKKIDIHKVQFIKEFDIYSSLWSNLVQLRSDVSLLRPKLDSRPNDKTKEEVDDERLQKAIISANNCIDLFEKQKPFYSHSIYTHLHSLAQLVNEEIIEVQFHQPTDREYYNKGEANFNKIVDLLEKICDDIRIRIGTK
ncbi:MAG: hypothetical protein ACJAUD_001887 [Crocinitomicaceae bacterium]|jgi:hypothetical protein